MIPPRYRRRSDRSFDRLAVDVAEGALEKLSDAAQIAPVDAAHAHQRLVAWSTRTTIAYEALIRSREPSLPHPGAMLHAAEQLGRVHELGRVIRAKAIAPGE